MTEERFIRENAEDWKSLEELLGRKAEQEKNFMALVRLNRLYRAAVGHLSYAQTHFPLSRSCQYLNTLVSRTYNRLYARKGGGLQAAGRALAFGFPKTVRRNGRFLLAAAGVFLACALYGYLFCWFSPESASAFVPPDYLNMSGQPGAGSASWDGAVMSSAIMVNNIYVSLMAFGGGLTLGLGTLYILAQNAMMLGGLAAVMTARGYGIPFWSLILPHGVWELFAICLSGAAGLMIGYALLRPGPYKRGDALVVAGRQAVGLMGFVCLLLVMAGLIEGFFTPANILPETKLVFAGVTAILLFCYLVFPGRRRGAAEDLKGVTR